MRPLTHSCFLLRLVGRLFLPALPFLLGTCLPSRWIPPFPPLHALALIPLFLAKVRLSLTLTLSPLMICYSGQTALFPFLLARAALAFLPTALSVALRPLFSFQQAQYVQVFPLKPAPFCTLFAGLDSINKSAIFVLLSFYLTLVLSSPLCPLLHLSSYLKLCGRSGRNCLLSDYNGSPDTRFSRGTTRLTSLPNGERYLCLVQSLVVSFLLSLKPTLLGLEAYCLIKILRHTGFLNFHRGTCAPSSCSLCLLLSSLQQTQPSLGFLSL